jgi:hypothetical protein
LLFSRHLTDTGIPAGDDSRTMVIRGLWLGNLEIGRSSRFECSIDSTTVIAEKKIIPRVTIGF